jgi:hypothetical protein
LVFFQAAPEEEEHPPELSSVDAGSEKPCFTLISFSPTQSPPSERNVSDLFAAVSSSIAHDETVNFSLNNEQRNILEDKDAENAKGNRATLPEEGIQDEEMNSTVSEVEAEK